MLSRRSTRQTATPAERSDVREVTCVDAGLRAVVMKEITMNWIGRFRASGRPESAHPRHEIVINGASDERHKDIRSSPESPLVPGNRPDAQRAEEIKRRQISLAVRCVWMMRAR